MSTNPETNTNPLSKFFRQPAIYITLPSGGRFWEEGALTMPENGELAVYPLTNRDEITLRTPDALLNGQGVVDVIHSCFPSIKNAWKTPSMDVDTVLIAMRIASYGHSMDFENKCPHCGEDHTYSMDLRHMMSTIKSPDYESPIELMGLKITFRPQNYFEVNRANQVNFEVAKLNDAVTNMTDGDAKSVIISTQVNRLIDLNHQVLAASTLKIEIMESNDVISDPAFILDFYKNIDATLFTGIQDLLLDKTKDASIKPIPVNCQSCEKQIDLTILFDYANFFVVGS